MGLRQGSKLSGLDGEIMRNQTDFLRNVLSQQEEAEKKIAEIGAKSGGTILNYLTIKMRPKAAGFGRRGQRPQKALPFPPQPQ